jgi:hypothetical protein
MLARAVRLLACEFQVLTDSEAVACWLDRAGRSAVQDYPVSRRHRLEVRGGVDGYRVREDGRDRGVERTPAGAGAHLERRFHELAFAALADHTKVHAGSAVWRGRRFLVAGHGRAGKSTLMSRLLCGGVGVEGDEMVLLREGQAVAYPRRFGIRRPTLTLVPQLAVLAPEQARRPDPHGPDGYHVLALDPAALGLPWRIGWGPVDAVFFLERDPGQPSRVVPCPRYVMAQRLMAHSAPPSGGRAAWIRDVCATLERATCYTLQLGDLDSAVAAVQRCLEPRAA